MTDKHTAESRQMIKVGVGFGVIAVVIATGIAVGIVVWKDSFFPPEGAPGSTAATLVFAGLAFFFSAGLAVWCLPPSGCDCGRPHEHKRATAQQGAQTEQQSA